MAFRLSNPRSEDEVLKLRHREIGIEGKRWLTSVVTAVRVIFVFRAILVGRVWLVQFFLPLRMSVMSRRMVYKRIEDKLEALSKG